METEKKKKSINWEIWLPLIIVFGIIFIVALISIIFIKPCLPCAFKALKGG